MKTLKITESDREGNTETIFHGTHPLSDYTLCGIALEGGTNHGITFSIAEDSFYSMNCPRCIRIVKHCKKIKLL